MSAAGGDRARLVQAFRSRRRPGAYLFVDRQRGLADVPKALLEGFGSPEPSIVFLLREDRPMARADAREVLAAIARDGYWLQLPPPEGDADLTDEAREFKARIEEAERVAAERAPDAEGSG